MTDRAYSCITNVCVLVAVVCALVFPHAGRFQVLVGSMAILVAIVSMAAYFIRHRNGGPTADRGGDVAKSGEAPTEGSRGTIGDDLSAAPCYAMMVVQRTLTIQVDEGSSSSAVGDFTGQIIDIVRTLAADENTAYEFTLGPDGQFTIRPQPKHFGATIRAADAETPKGSYPRMAV